ncbi:MAG TPA: TIGR03086 family metal-binding protein [Streptosporangiaceae bacterium]
MAHINLTPATGRLASLISGVSDDQLARPTPCPAYTLGDLIDHVGGLALSFNAAGQKEFGPYTESTPAGDAARLGSDWRIRIPRDLGTLALTWQESGAWAGMTRIARMDAPAEMVGMTLADELLVHGWDVAMASGQKFDYELEVLEAAQSFLTQIANPDAPAGPEVAFGPPRELPDSTVPLDRVVAMAGRDHAWSAS